MFENWLFFAKKRPNLNIFVPRMESWCFPKSNLEGHMLCRIGGEKTFMFPLCTTSFSQSNFVSAGSDKKAYKYFISI